jgi:hypothetical protein
LVHIQLHDQGNWFLQDIQYTNHGLLVLEVVVLVVVVDPDEDWGLESFRPNL